MSGHETELERIRTAYRVRDGAATPAAAPVSPWSGAGYRFYMQRLEWELLAALRRAGAEVAGAQVLEVGCGSGYFLHRLREYGAAEAAGIDLMEDRIDQARERYPTLELVAGDASELPWDDGSFDLVTHFTCLSSVLDPSLRAAIADDMWRVLRPGGLIVSYDMRGRPWPMRAAGALRARLLPAAPAGAVTPTTPIVLDELRRLWPAGDLRHRAVTLSPELWPLAERGRWLAELAAMVPALRTHLLATVRKPA
jgi:SAM-dependent methyltransferase